MVLAQACTPGMSCFGRVVLLQNGEVETAAAAAAAAATAKATSAKSKAEQKSGEQAKAEPKMFKRRVTCELVGANVKQPRKPIRCSYHCPGEPDGVVHEIFLDVPACPPSWDFYI